MTFFVSLRYLLCLNVIQLNSKLKFYIGLIIIEMSMFQIGTY